MRYFDDREQAGKELAKKLTNYANKNCAIIALNEGGVVVGLEIAKKIHSSLFLLTTESIKLPGEPEPIATMTSAGTFTYNSGSYSTGELEELDMEYHNFVEEKRLEAFQKLNRISSKGGDIPKTLLKDRVIIVVADGLKNGLSLDVAADFLKPVRNADLVVAVPFASVPAVDKMHVLSDKIHCLSVIENYMSTNHYYEKNDLPAQEEILKIIDEISLHWENSASNNN